MSPVSDLDAAYEAPVMEFTTKDILRGARADTVRNNVKKMAGTQFVHYNHAIR